RPRPGPGRSGSGAGWAWPVFSVQRAAGRLRNGLLGPALERFHPGQPILQFGIVQRALAMQPVEPVAELAGAFTVREKVVLLPELRRAPLLDLRFDAGTICTMVQNQQVALLAGQELVLRRISVIGRQAANAQDQPEAALGPAALVQR